MALWGNFISVQTLYELLAETRKIEGKLNDKVRTDFSGPFFVVIVAMANQIEGCGDIPEITVAYNAAKWPIGEVDCVLHL